MYISIDFKSRTISVIMDPSVKDAVNTIKEIYDEVEKRFHENWYNDTVGSEFFNTAEKIALTRMAFQQYSSKRVTEEAIQEALNECRDSNKAEDGYTRFSEDCEI